MVGVLLSPSKFPRASVRRTAPAVGRVAWGPQEEDAARGFYHCGVRHARLPPDAQLVCLAIGQPPTEPNRQRLEASLRSPSQASPVRRTAGAAAFVEVDAHYEPPASEAGAYKPVQGDTQWLSAR